MAPELITKLIVLDLAYREDETLTATRYLTSRMDAEFLVKWYPLESTPKGFQGVAKGALFVPEELNIDEETGVTIQCTPRGCSYQDDADMLVLILPRGTTLSWQEDKKPWSAKEFDDRVAVYWLRPDGGRLIEVVWSLPESNLDAKKVTENLNAFLEVARGAVPNFFVDDYEHYDVALSYASEDRVHAEAIAKILKQTGKRVFFDHDVQSRLWGKGLPEELAAIYSKRATFCVLFVSEQYKKKRWTLAELRAAVEGAALTGRNDYILPVQIDDTKLDELPQDIVYVPIATGIETICEGIVEKLNRV